MSIAAVSSSSIYQELQAFFQQRNSDVAHLGQDLTAGNLASAKQDFATLKTLGQGGPFANGDVFAPSNQREQYFTAIGQALKAGNLGAAQQAFAQLESTFHGKGGGSDTIASVTSAATSAPTPASTSTASSQSIYGQLQEFRQERKAEISQLGQDLASGNTANALQDFNALQELGQSGPFKSGTPFNKNAREQDFAAIGQALQAGDLTGAQQAFAQLEATFQKNQTMPPIYKPPVSTNSAASTVPLAGALDTTA